MGTLDYTIIDNFLEKDDFIKFQNELFCTKNCFWFYRESMLIENVNNLDDTGYFTLSYFNNLRSDFTYHDYFLYKIYEKLNCKAIIQSRANLVLKQNNLKKLFFHVDYPFECKTAIFYMNTNNGGTILDPDKKIKIDSIENRILIFNSQIKHCALLQSDTKRRIVININYF